MKFFFEGCDVVLSDIVATEIIKAFYFILFIMLIKNEIVFDLVIVIA